MSDSLETEPLNIGTIERLAALVADSGIEALSLHTATGSISIRQNRPVVAAATPAPTSAKLQTATKTVAVPPQPAGPLWITAPMVGVFHPADPPVRKGNEVEPGQVVGMIESMKLMNDVRATEPGIVTEVAIEAEMPVEYGQPLFALKR